MPRPAIAVVGAGIAGLTAAIAFARKGADVDLIEQAERFAPVGAGLQLSPNAARILDHLGLTDDLAEHWREPEAIRLLSGASLRALAAVPAGAFARERWGAPYAVIHRAHLHDVLLAHAEQNGVRFVMGARIDEADATALRGRVAELAGRPPRLVVGADGVWSAVRGAVPASGRSRFSGDTAWRAVVPARAAEGIVPLDATSIFLGPSTHLVAYPLAVDGTVAVNLVAITHGGDRERRWDRAADAHAVERELLPAFSRWHPRLRALLRQSRGVTRWPLFEVTEGAWNAGTDIVLIGDAAHAMMPFAAQGAAQAIEDAFELAQAVMDNDGAAEALSAFVARRKARVERVRERTAFNRFAYHARGPLRLGRDLVFATRSGERLAADLDWLYGYRPDGL